MTRYIRTAVILFLISAICTALCAVVNEVTAPRIAENVEKEIRGLFDAGLTGGYTTWLSSSNIEKYRSQADAFKIDYYAEWKRKNGR